MLALPQRYFSAVRNLPQASLGWRFACVACIVLALTCGVQGKLLADEASGCASQPEGDGACADKRYCGALIIGNRTYRGDHAEVKAANADVKVMREALNEHWKFAVSVQENADADCAKRRWSSFLRSLETAASNKHEIVAVIYYSGHGMDHGDDSLLLPVDAARADEPTKILSQSLSLQKMFGEFRTLQNRLESEAITLHGVFIIDACRVLLAEGAQSAAMAAAKASVSTMGLSPVVPPPGLFVLYAASRGQAARTHVGPNYVEGKESVFTGHLKDLLMHKKRLSIRLQHLASRVQWLTYQTTYEPGREAQTPDHFDRMTGSQINIGGEEVKDQPLCDEATEAEPPLCDKSMPTVIRNARSREILWERDTFPKLVVIDKATGADTPRPPEGSAPSATADAQPVDTLHDPPRLAVGRTEVTEGEFHAFLSATSPNDARLKSGNRKNDKRPMTGITWSEAQQYVAWLNTTAGLSPPESPSGAATDKGYYRLPTEAEWEYAARGGSAGAHVHGGDHDDVAKLCQFANGADATLKTTRWTNSACSDGFGRGLAPAASFTPNGFGLYDMVGNAWEWVADCWRSGLERPRAIFDERYTCADQGNGGVEACVLSKNCERHVARGGSWLSGPGSLKLTERTAFPAGHARSTLGFRVVRVLGSSEIAP